MPDLGSATFSQSDSSNQTGTMPSWSGSAAPSTIDDAGRALQGAITREWNWRNPTVTAGGTGTAQTLTYSVAPAAYYNGQRFAFLSLAVTGSCTLNVNALGAKTIKKVLAGTLTNLASGDIASGAFVDVAYNLANDCFVWMNGPSFAGPSGTASQGDIIYYDGSAWSRLAAGTSGNFLKTQGAGANPTWASDLTIVGSGAVGYATGSGGTVTQATSNTTGVTLNKTNGQIVMFSGSVGAGQSVVFTVTNSTVAATDNVIVTIASGGNHSSNSGWVCGVNSTAAGSFQVYVYNKGTIGGSTTLTLNFAVIKSVTA